MRGRTDQGSTDRAPAQRRAAAAIGACLLACSAPHAARPAEDNGGVKCPSELAPVVYAAGSGQPGWLLGAARGCTWLGASDAAPLLLDGQRYQVIARRGFARAATGARPLPNGEQACPGVQLVKLTPPTEFGEWLAVGGAWNVAPAPVDAVAPEQRHRQAVGAQLGRHGLDGAPIAITQLLRADLARDGAPDDLIVATVGSAIDRVEAGQYSFVLLLQSHRRADPVETLLAGEFHTVTRDAGAPDLFRVVDLIDLDGDGMLEILVEFNAAEGWGVQVYDHLGRKTPLAARCGG